VQSYDGRWKLIQPGGAMTWYATEAEARAAGVPVEILNQDDDGIDWADIERRVAAMSPDQIMHVVDQERQAATYTWERHEYRVWVENHAPTPEQATQVVERQRTKRQQDEAQARAKWDRWLADGKHSALRGELHMLRNTVRKKPSAHIWADWRIRELNAIVAQLPDDGDGRAAHKLPAEGRPAREIPRTANMFSGASP
jgi:hypothetical protein